MTTRKALREELLPVRRALQRPSAAHGDQRFDPVAQVPAAEADIGGDHVEPAG